jgi:hypothetical protein
VTWLRTLAPRDLRAFIALWASIGGTMALTCFALWLTWILWRGGWSVGTELARIEKLGLIAVLIIIIMGITMTGLGLAINRRQMKGSAFGASFEASGGDDVPAAAQAVAEAAIVKADQITDGAKP